MLNKTDKNGSQVNLMGSAGYYQRRFWNWIHKRIPASNPQTLDRKILFVFPSASGFGFLVVNTLLWLVGTNYENNIIIGLAFLLASMFVVSIIHTFSNLSGLTIRAINSVPVYAGDDAEIELLVTTDTQQPHENVQLHWSGGNTSVANLIDAQEVTLKLFVPTKTRGLMNPGRLLVESYYPLGIIRCWTWLDLDVRVLVYPKAVYGGKMPLSLSLNEQGQWQASHGAEDFSGLKRYQAGESLRHVAWKHYARGQGLHTKEYTAYEDQRLWLDWDFFAGLDKEARLSRLCYWIVEAAKTQNEYGLRLPGVEIEPGKGLEHKHKLLKALALYEPD